MVGTLDLSLLGVLAWLVGPPAGAGVGVFAVSTFVTDYLLVRASGFEWAVDVLRGAGHAV